MGFLSKAVKALVDGRGLIVIKENIGLEDIFDDEDSSVTRQVTNQTLSSSLSLSLPLLLFSLFTRTMASFKKIFRLANLTIIKEEYQPNWPNKMFPVCMYVVRDVIATFLTNVLHTTHSGSL